MQKTLVKALLIDVTAQEVREVEWDSSLGAMHKLIGGFIEHVRAAGLADGDALYVDEEGMLKPAPGFFVWDGYHQPLFGNGLVVGPELDADEMANADVQTPLATVRALVRFLSPEQVAAWGKANASEPAITITAIHATGKVEHEVFTRYGKLIDEALNRKGEP